MIVGWEYTVEATIGGYGAVEKNYHMCRRRRWVRSRKLDKDAAVLEEEVSKFHFVNIGVLSVLICPHVCLYF